MLNVPSGELHYQLGGADEALGSTSEEFRDFLAIDLNKDKLEDQYREQLESLEDLEKRVRKNLTHAAKLEKKNVEESIHMAIDAQVHALECERTRLFGAMDRLQQSSDANAAQVVIQYFNLMKTELEENRKLLYAAALEAEMLKKQARVRRDVMMFSHYLKYETKDRVKVMSLESESSQFKRCRKAVNDSLGPLLKRSGYVDAKVLAVLKIEHALISAQLQKSAASIDEGKVKGLFCVIPEGALQSFVAFGLHAQASSHELPALYTRQEAARAQMMMKDKVNSGLSNLFQISWIWAQADDDEEEAEDITGGRGAHYAENQARKSLTAIQGACTPPITKATEYDEAKTCSYLKFSRSSTPSGLEVLSPEHLEQGCFLALCRVLISKCRTVNGPITDWEARDAAELDYDCVYSTSTEEYVLLKPEFALPEFVMHVEMVPPDEPHTQSASMRSVNEHKEKKREANQSRKSALLGHLEGEEKTWLPGCLQASPKSPRDRGEDFEGGASMRSRNGQVELSSNLFAQTPADILINNLANAAQQQDSSLGTKESSTKRGAADETEGVLDAASSPRRQERETNREQAAQKQALVNAIARGADDFQGSLRDLLQKALWRDREDEDEPGRRRPQRKIQEVDEDEMGE